MNCDVSPELDKGNTKHKAANTRHCLTQRQQPSVVNTNPRVGELFRVCTSEYM